MSKSLFRTYRPESRRSIQTIPRFGKLPCSELCPYLCYILPWTEGAYLGFLLPWSRPSLTFQSRSLTSKTGCTFPFWNSHKPVHSLPLISFKNDFSSSNSGYPWMKSQTPARRKLIRIYNIHMLPNAETHLRQSNLSATLNSK